MTLPSKHRAGRLFVLPALMGLLAGCGGSGSSSNQPTTALTNPDHVLFASGRAEDNTWHFYAMNPDGSDVTQIPALNTLKAVLSEGITLNQNGSLACVTLDSGVQPGPGPTVTKELIRLSDGVTLFSKTMSTVDPLTLFAANSNGSQIAFLGSPASGDPYALYVMAPDGTQKTRVYTLPSTTTVNELLFSPDNRTLYFAAQLNGINPLAPAGVLYKLPLGSSTPTAIATLDAPITSIHTSRDGSRLAFLRVTQATDLQSSTILPYTVNADGSSMGSEMPQIVQGALDSWNAAIASRADGFHILYTDPVDGASEIFDVRLDGSAKTQITFNAAGNNTPGSRQATQSAKLRSLGGR